jgi:hypothetical protein
LFGLTNENRVLVSRCDGALHIHQALPVLFFSPILISTVGCGGEVAIVKEPLLKIKITLLNIAATLATDSLMDMAGALIKVPPHGGDGVSQPGSKASPASFWLCHLSTLCLSFFA